MDKLAENIRQLRKQRKLTQEHLAEAMGVSFVSVSKWENSKATPSLEMVMDLADFFGVSTDTLLGYTRSKLDVNQTVEDIYRLMSVRDYAAAERIASQALQHNPHSLMLSYVCGGLYYEIGKETSSESKLRRALELSQAAYDLYLRGDNEDLNEVLLQRRIATVYLRLGETESALEWFRKNGAEKLNAPQIGRLLALQGGKPQEAAPYLANSILNAVFDIYNTTVPLSKLYLQRDDPEQAVACLEWALAILESLRQTDEPGFGDHMYHILSMDYFTCLLDLGRWEELEEEIPRLEQDMARFYENPSYSLSAIRFCSDTSYHTAFTGYGQTAQSRLESIRQRWEKMAEAARQKPKTES